MEEKNEIDIMRLIGVLIKRWYLVVGAGLVVGVLAFLYTNFLVTPLYRATAKVYVSNKVDYNTNQEEAAISDLTTSQSLVPIYSTMVRTNMVLEKVAKSDELIDAGIEYDAQDLSEMISTEQYEDTAVLLLNVVNPNKEYCSIIANSIATTGVTEIANVNDGSTGYVIDAAETPEEPFYPSVGRNVLIGFLVGFFLMAAAIALSEIFDTKIKDEEVFAGIIGAPVLGKVGALTAPKTAAK